MLSCSGFAGDLQDSKSTPGGIFCRFESHTFMPRSWMCKKQTSVSHSSTEFETFSLYARLRMDGIPAFDFFDLVIRSFHSSSNKFTKFKENVKGNMPDDTSSRQQTKNQVKTPIRHDELELCNVD